MKESPTLHFVTTLFLFVFFKTSVGVAIHMKNITLQTRLVISGLCLKNFFIVWTFIWNTALFFRDFFFQNLHFYDSHFLIWHLTHWGLVMPRGIRHLDVNICSGNCSAPFRLQTINCTNADLFSIGPMGTNFDGNLNQNTKLFIRENVLKNVICKMTAILFRPHCASHQQHCQMLSSSHQCKFQDMWMDTKLMTNFFEKQTRQIFFCRSRFIF